MNFSHKAQVGVLSDPTPFVEYLTFNLLKPSNSEKNVADSLAMISNIAKSIGQKDSTADLSITIGISAAAWNKIFPDHPMPSELHDFVELKEDRRHFPSTGGDIFFMIKSRRQDLNFQAARHLYLYLRDIASLDEDIQGYQYLDNRDLIDFVDGTENPKGDQRNESVLTSEAPYEGGSYLVVQKYLHRDSEWSALSTEEQEAAIGRSKMDDIEIDDDKKALSAHNLKSKVTVDGEEIKMLRQNRAFGTALEHGTMFIGFAASVSVIETSLQQMILTGTDGCYDRLLDFVDAVTGANYFVPPQTLLDEIAS